MFKKKKKESQPLNVNKEHYSVAIIDYLRNNAPTKLGIQCVILSMFEKNYFHIDKKVVNLGTPWAPDEQEIIRMSLTSSIDPDKISEIEDHIINWVIFTFGDGVYTNITQVYRDLNKKDFKDAHSEMYQGYQSKVVSLAERLNLVDSDYGKIQKQYYEESEESTLNSKKLVYHQPIDVNPLIQNVLDLFDQTL